MAISLKKLLEIWTFKKPFNWERLSERLMLKMKLKKIKIKGEHLYN
jgi:hypothetical protein